MDNVLVLKEAWSVFLLMPWSRIIGLAATAACFYKLLFYCLSVIPDVYGYFMVKVNTHCPYTWQGLPFVWHKARISPHW